MRFDTHASAKLLGNAGLRQTFHAVQPSLSRKSSFQLISAEKRISGGTTMKAKFFGFECANRPADLSDAIELAPVGWWQNGIRIRGLIPLTRIIRGICAS